MKAKVLQLALAAAFAATAQGALAQNAEPTTATPTGPNDAAGAKDNFDPVYNVCRGTDPRCYHPWVDNRQNKVLLYTRTAGPRHANLGPALPAGTNPPLTRVAHACRTRSSRGWPSRASQRRLDRGRHAPDQPQPVQGGDLRQHQPRHAVQARHGRQPAAAVNTTTNAHLDAGKTALRQYIRAGGGFVGIHNAFGTEYNWQWYEGLLGNANYYDHGANQDGTS